MAGLLAQVGSSDYTENSGAVNTLTKVFPIDRLPLYPESNSVPRFGAGGKAGAAQMRGKPPGL